MAPNIYVEKYDETKRSIVDKILTTASKVSTDHWVSHFRKPTKD